LKLKDIKIKVKAQEVCATWLAASLPFNYQFSNYNRNPTDASSSRSWSHFSLPYWLNIVFHQKFSTAQASTISVIQAFAIVPRIL
jgi:hypothetical protein